MKSMLCLFALPLLLLACSPQYAAACPPVVVQSHGVVVQQAHCAPVAVQSLGVPVQQYATVQSVQVQAVPVQAFVVQQHAPVQVLAVDHCGGAVVQRSVVVERRGGVSRSSVFQRRGLFGRSVTVQRTVVR